MCNKSPFLSMQSFNHSLWCATEPFFFRPTINSDVVVRGRYATKLEFLGPILKWAWAAFSRLLRFATNQSLAIIVVLRFATDDGFFLVEDQTVESFLHLKGHDFCIWSNSPSEERTSVIKRLNNVKGSAPSLNTILKWENKSAAPRTMINPPSHNHSHDRCDYSF